MKGNELKPRIGIFGRRNYGKSTLFNYLAGQQIAIVSSLAGTTTDPVRKTMEISGIGPVVWIDTAGLDDEGDVGQMRVNRSLDTLAQVDLALILVTDNRFGHSERKLIESCHHRHIPFLIIYSQADRSTPDPHFLAAVEREAGTQVFTLSVHDESRREPLLNQVRKLLSATTVQPVSVVGDLVRPADDVILVTPIDSSAPEGRMILPQVQVLRDLLDHHACAHFCREDELQHTLQSLNHNPRLVITDSQVFPLVAATVPDHIPLTSFSILLARAKGLFDEYLKGTPTIDSLCENDRVLMLESCTHNVTCEDIGRVKLPRLLQQYVGHPLQCETVAGLSDIPRPLSEYRLVIQCGGCVITPRQIRARLEPALQAGVPVSNYGLSLAFLSGIFYRATSIFTSLNRSSTHKI